MPAFDEGRFLTPVHCQLARQTQAIHLLGVPSLWASDTSANLQQVAPPFGQFRSRIGY
jgi:hypothetical protein